MSVERRGLIGKVFLPLGGECRFDERSTMEELVMPGKLC